MKIEAKAKQRSMFFLLAALLILTLAGCLRPASQAPSGEVTATGAEGGLPLPGTQNVMGQLESFATQTAIAMQGGAAAPTISLPGQETQVAPTAEGATGGETPAAPEAATPEAGTTPEVAPTAEVPAGPTNTPAPIPELIVPDNYTLRGGEFPYCIARRFNVDPGEMLQINGLGPNTPTSPGMTLKIPKTGNNWPGDASLKSHPTTYTVRSGDTVYSIACQFGDVDPNAILAVNGIGEGKQLEAGQTLQIP
jgi:LysM repeat protein